MYEDIFGNQHKHKEATDMFIDIRDYREKLEEGHKFNQLENCTSVGIDLLACY